MSQSWYGQHGHANTVAHHPPQPPASSMHHPRFHHVNAPGPSMVPGPAQAYPRSSPPVGRPPSSASTSSASSYATAVGSASGHPRSHHQPQGMPMNVGRSPPPLHHGNPHHLHHGGHQGGFRPMGGGPGRYPMPPRNAAIAHGPPGRPIPPPMRQHHGVPPPPPPVAQPPVSAAPGAGEEPLRRLLNGSAPPPREHPHNGHSQFAPRPPTNALIRTGHGPPMHHPVPYRRFHPMAQSNGPPHGLPHAYHRGNHGGPRRNNYPPPGLHPHQSMSHPDAKYHQHHQYMRPPYEPSPETTVDQQSPSPPPAPPADNATRHAGPSSQPASAPVDRVIPPGNPLRERQNVQQAPASAPLGKPKSANEADAASILLQLSSVIKQSASSENLKNVAGDEENARAPTSLLGKPESPKDYPQISPATTLDTIQESRSIDSTVATLEAVDSAPDLASEPSSDSIESYSDFPAHVPENFPTRLSLPYDDSKLNSLHCFLRSELLEIFVVQKSLFKSPTHSPGSSVGRVGLRCVHCALVRRQREDRDEAPMAVFYPKSIAEIYRLVTSWQRCHLRKCRSLPPAIRSQWQKLRENDKSRGKTHYWITSAKEIGLIDCQSRAGGIRFGPNVNKNNASSLSDNDTPTPMDDSSPTTTTPSEITTTQMELAATTITSV